MAQQYEAGESALPTSSPSSYYTMVPNAFFDALVPQLAPQQVAIACWIIRQTVGWDREWSPPIGYRQLGLELDLDKMTVMRHIQAGLKGGWLDRQGSGTSFEYRISGFLDGSCGKQQPLNGNFTKIPHTFFESLVPSLDPFALKIYCWIVRQSTGWNREWTTPTSFSQISRAIGIDRKPLRRHLQSLEQQGVVVRSEGTHLYQYRLARLKAGQQSSKPQGLAKPPTRTYVQSPKSTVCAKPHRSYAQSPTDRMRKAPVSSPAKERKVRYRRTTTTSDSSSFPSNHRKEGNTKHLRDKEVVVSLDRVRQNVSEAADGPTQATRKQPPESEQDSLDRLTVIADLDLEPRAKDTLVSHFPVEVLQQGMAWLATASNLNDLGRAFYAACRDGYEPLRSSEETASEDRAWAKETFGHLDGAMICGQRLDLARSGAEIMGEGSTRGPEVIDFGSREFRSRLQERMDRIAKAQADRSWVKDLLAAQSGDIRSSARIEVTECYVRCAIGEGSRSRLGVLQYGQQDFRQSVEQLVGLASGEEVIVG